MSISITFKALDLPTLNLSGVTGIGGGELSGDGDVDILIEVKGSTGIDFLDLEVNLNDLNIVKGKESWVVTHKAIDDVVMTLDQIERVDAIGKSLALDVKGAAGEVYALLCTAFGKADVTPAMVGEYLFQKDTFTRLGLTKVDEMLASNILSSVQYKEDAMGTSHETFVKQVYKNVLGTAPSFADLMYFVMELDKGTFTQAQLLEAASNLELTRTNIDLVGLEATGIQYVYPGA